VLVLVLVLVLAMKMMRPHDKAGSLQ